MAKPTSNRRAAPKKTAVARGNRCRKTPIQSKTKPERVLAGIAGGKGASGGKAIEKVPDQLDCFQAQIAGYRGEPGALIPLLQAAQEAYGYIPEAAIQRIHEAIGAPEAEIYGVITFYSQFRLKPLGQYLIKLCDGTACHVNGSERLATAIEDELKLGGNDTTDDGLFTVQKVACLGCCSLSPVIMINEETYGRLTAKKVQLILKEYKAKASKVIAAGAHDSLGD